MIAFPAGVKVWIAGGVTDMRRGMNTLALQVQEGLGCQAHQSLNHESLVLCSRTEYSLHEAMA